MHLSYRGATYLPPSESLIALQSSCPSTHRLSLGSLGSPTVQRCVRLVVALSQLTSTALQSITQQAIAYSQISMNFSKSYSASAAPDVSEYSGQDAAGTHQDELYAIERRLQLAYAVGNRQQIRMLEADLEAVTGVRFSRQRTWLDQ